MVARNPALASYGLLDDVRDVVFVTCAFARIAFCEVNVGQVSLAEAFEVGYHHTVNAAGFQDSPDFFHEDRCLVAVDVLKKVRMIDCIHALRATGDTFGEIVDDHVASNAPKCFPSVLAD